MNEFDNNNISDQFRGVYFRCLIKEVELQVKLEIIYVSFVFFFNIVILFNSWQNILKVLTWLVWMDVDRWLLWKESWPVSRSLAYKYTDIILKTKKNCQ